MEHSLTLWVIFNAFIIAMLLIDLFVFHGKEHEESIKEALIWTGVWITLALVFGVGVYYYMGSATALDYYTGYLIEKSLSVDNIFVFLLVFTYFQVPAEYQHKVLFWGIFGALVMRFLFIFIGVALLEQFHWIIYVFGGFLVYTGIKLALEKDKEVHPEKNPVLLLVRRFIPTVKTYYGSNFFVKKMGRRVATPMFVVLIVIETTDVVFALDSIPAILAITRDEFIVYSSNAFAILGLRALYFALAGIMKLFHYLHYGLSLILIFVGIKMLTAEFYHIPTPWALGVIAFTLTASIVASIMFPKKEDDDLPVEEIPVDE
ncbi:TerC family protein [Aliifodinibius sp. S!AR15-10]|uniref:TerC family protein n=1 Tax=Aliifodinibius sp. S!AR15-10 TaxID=2950437 RepID=UPI002863E011|nr:TerC family protein [Aliifodinibius sp. S!AR15-10]MDR8392789.1 TerC family protein [Aliifodinibius sp. S!AR15-10]